MCLYPMYIAVLFFLSLILSGAHKTLEGNKDLAVQSVSTNYTTHERSMALCSYPARSPLLSLILLALCVQVALCYVRPPARGMAAVPPPPPADTPQQVVTSFRYLSIDFIIYCYSPSSNPLNLPPSGAHIHGRRG